MVTIDLTTPPAPAASFLDGMARRLALTLPELRLVAELAGGAPLPFDLQPADDAAPGHGLPVRSPRRRAAGPSRTPPTPTRSARCTTRTTRCAAAAW